MRRIFNSLLILSCILGLTSCANFNSISRTTPLIGSFDGREGKAIHLDAQQRLVLINNLGKICAEPSPDAMAAYAASLGISASVPRAGSGALSHSQQASIASIGLRTQSITLMRDALYRMCEAFINNAAGPTQIVTLLGRSQDLTAVILAVEQLTGAVAANQAALTGTTSASASASLLSNQALLDAARENETNKNNELEEAKVALKSAEEARNSQEKTETAAKAERNKQVNNSSATDAEKATAQKNWERSKEELDRAQREVDAADNTVQTRKKLYEEAQKNRAVIEKAKDSSLNNTIANTTSSSEFSTPISRVQLDKTATESITKAVQAMVEKVLDKNYIEESCMATLGYFPESDWDKDQKQQLREIKDSCLEIIKHGINQRVAAQNFDSDKNTARIIAWQKSNPDNNTKLNNWLKNRGYNFSSTLLIYGSENKSLRDLAISELMIP